MRKGAMALIVVVLATAAGAGIASAVTPLDALPVSSTISIASVDLGFHGKVRAALPFCRSDRRVALFKVVDGGPDEAMGHTRTNAHGRWGITVSGFAGVSLARFYAVARRKRGHVGQLPYLCGAATSKAISPALG